MTAPADPPPGLPLVLASGSPRRRALLAVAGYRFDTDTPDVDERIGATEPAADAVRRLAVAKATAVAARRPGACVLACDTVVVLGVPGAETVLGKPGDAADAVRMLLLLAGRSHRVLTGFAVVVAAKPAVVEVVESTVAMHPVSAAEAAAYAAGGEPLDKAGAYAFQGEGSRFVAGVSGSRSNVVGLPLRPVVAALERLGVARRPAAG